ncbi:MAG: LptA/OstA family protein [Elusimicrobiota bacterium]
MNTKFYGFSLLITSYLLLLTHLYCEQEINITSDKMEYDKVNSKSVFTGNVKLKAGDVSLSCDTAEMDIIKKDIYLEKVFFTSCNLENPHYQHYAKRVHLILEKEITAKNVVFYVDDIPSGALPYYYKSLREKKLKIDFKHGYNQSEDYFSRGFIGYKFSEQFFSKIYLDYYSYKGWGYGIEEIYNVGSKMQGSVYGYHIWEHDTRIRRWNARIYHQQNFTDTWSTQINSNLASDESFNNFYTRDWIRIYRDVNSSVAFTRNTGMSTGRILFSRRDVFNTDDNKYLLTGMTVPSVSYITNQIKIRKLPLYYEFSANGEKTWIREEDFYRTNANSSLKFTNPLRLTRKITLTSAAGVKTYWQDRLNKEDIKDIDRWTYNTDLNLDIRSLNFLDHQFGYYFEQEPDKRHDDYRGVIADKLRTKHSAYIDNLTVRVWTGLDVRKSSSSTQSFDFKQRLDGITSEFDYSIYNFLNIYYRNDYNVFYEKPNSVQLNSELRLGPDRFDKSKEKAYLKNGVSYNRSTPNHLTFTGEVGLRPTANWQVAYKMQSSFSYDFTEHRNNFKDYRYYERSVNIYRDLHCWEANFSYLDRVPLKAGERNFYEFWFNIRIKSNLSYKSDTAESERERKWYPWR